jgi:hypothetical protein
MERLRKRSSTTVAGAVRTSCVVDDEGDVLTGEPGEGESYAANWSTSSMSPALDHGQHCGLWGD